MSFELGLRCRDCGKTFPTQPLSGCDECFAPLEVYYDLEAIQRAVTREQLASRPFHMWRYREFLPVPTQGEAASHQRLPVGGTPLLKADRLAKVLGVRELYIKNDAVNFPTLSFKDRVVAIALSKAREFGYDTVACSSTGNLANAVAAQAAALGFRAFLFTPADLEPAKIANSLVYGAHLVKFSGNYDQVNRLSTEIAQKYPWGIVNVNLRPYYAEGSKTVGFEIAEQLNWSLPGTIVCPMAGGSLIGKIARAFDELRTLGWAVGETRICGAQATGCSPISTAVKNGTSDIEPQRPNTIARSLAIGNPADGFYASKLIRESGGYAEDVSDPEIVEAMQLLASTEGVFAETAGGVTLASARKLIDQGRVDRERPIVLVITGNGLKTLDAIVGAQTEAPVLAPRMRELEAWLDSQGVVAGEPVSASA